MIKGRAYGRVGLLGNPSDIYGGKCISFTISSSAEVEIKDSDQLRIHGNYVSGFLSSDGNGTHELITATIKHLGKYLDSRIENESMDITYRTRIPIGSGLAGSSAIIIAAIKAFNKRFGWKLNKSEIAELALHTEIDELDITGGFQDRYIISYGGVLYMDFTGKEYMRKEDPLGSVHQLDVDNIPFFIALSVQPKKSSTVHNPLRQEFLSGPDYRRREIKAQMDNIAAIAEQGVNVLLRRDWYELGRLMDKNTELREQVSRHLEVDMEIIKFARECGTLGAKVAGSGGAVVVLTKENDNSVIEKMQKVYPCFRPDIARYE
ncbi:MAG: hypothetical protein Q8N99_02225 [Nanoarchaeota archaeon]|nr:hypothetical protein [Nanoarchaeota archaeon]